MVKKEAALMEELTDIQKIASGVTDRLNDALENQLLYLFGSNTEVYAKLFVMEISDTGISQTTTFEATYNKYWVTLETQYRIRPKTKVELERDGLVDEWVRIMGSRPR